MYLINSGMRQTKHTSTIMTLYVTDYATQHSP